MQQRAIFILIVIHFSFYIHNIIGKGIKDTLNHYRCKSLVKDKINDIFFRTKLTEKEREELSKEIKSLQGKNNDRHTVRYRNTLSEKSNSNYVMFH